MYLFVMHGTVILATVDGDSFFELLIQHMRLWQWCRISTKATSERVMWHHEHWKNGYGIRLVRPNVLGRMR